MEPFVMMLKHFAQVCLITPSKLSLILRYLDTGVTLGAAGPDQELGDNKNKEMWVGELGEYAVIDNMLVPRASLPRTNAGGSEAEPGEGETVEEEIFQVEIVANTGFKWDHPKTMMFLDAYQKEVDGFRNPKVKKKLFGPKLQKQCPRKDT
ncbi:unnamed protein product [Callosobruchus maculatus]|uniref:Uncharacterized protein n=1 Tax=Callosobruchus maculatus TaxID=64391 RepID=A0A653DFR1_CALMS|nr:unnamed protein product [Callosobruchus maculatus]